MTQDTITQPDATPQATPSPTVETGPVLHAEPLYENYWGTDETYTYTLKDGKQFFVIQPMDEGKKARFQRKTNKGIRVNQSTNDAHLDVDPAGERHQLILDSVIDYNLMQLSVGADPRNPDSWSKFPVSNPPSRNLQEWLLRANPKTVQDLEFFIRTKNPWMQADMDVEEIDKEIDRLHTLRQQVLEQKEGEDVSANK